MDLGKPISGLPKPSSPFPERGTSEPLDLADPDEVAEPACGSEPLVVADRGRVDEPTPPSIDIPLPGFWKFAHAWLLFAFFAFPAIIAGSRHPSDLGVLLPIGAVYLGLVWRITRSSISGSAESLVVPWGGGLLRRTLPSVTSVSISGHHHLRHGLWALRFVSDGSETRALVLPRLPWDLVNRSPLDRPPGDREWIAQAVSALKTAGIDVTYTGR